jgi:hypothetical protein
MWDGPKKNRAVLAVSGHGEGYAKRRSCLEPVPSTGRGSAATSSMDVPVCYRPKMLLAGFEPAIAISYGKTGAFRVWQARSRQFAPKILVAVRGQRFTPF